MKHFFSILLIVIALLSANIAVMSISASKVAAQESSVVIKSTEQPSLANEVATRLESSWPWYLTRASGFIASICLIILMLSGIGQITGHTFKFLEPITAWATHRALGIAFLGAVIIHVGSLLFDRFVSFSLIDLLVPFASNHNPLKIGTINVGSLYLALGICAFYLTIAIVVTSLLWVDKKPYVWKLVHLLSYVTMAFVFVHGLYLGSDTDHGILRLGWVLLAISVLVASIWRLRRANYD